MEAGCGRWSRCTPLQSKRLAFGRMLCCWMSNFIALLIRTIHYNDAIMGAMASQITSLAIVFSTVYSDADQRKHQRSASLSFVRRIHRRPVNSPHKWPVTRKMFPFDDDIMLRYPLLVYLCDIPPKDVYALGPSLLLCFGFLFPTSIFSWLSLWCLVPWINHFPLYVCSIFGKSIVNKLVCNAIELMTVFLYYVYILIDSDYWYMYYYQIISVCFISILPPVSNSF